MLIFANSNSNLENGHVHLPSNSRSGFGYQGMVQKTQTILAYLYNNFLDDFDFFHSSGDNTYLIVENLNITLHLTKLNNGMTLRANMPLLGLCINITDSRIEVILMVVPATKCPKI